MKVTNTSKAIQGVNTKSGQVFIRPGQTKDVDLTPEGEKQVKRLDFMKVGAAAAKKAEKPADKPADTGLKAEHHGGGKFNVTQGETVLLQGLSKADADAFNAMSEAEKAEYVEASKN